MTWWVLAIIVSFANCIPLDINKKLKMDGIRGRGWTSFFAFSFLTPIVWFIDFPTSPQFYVSALIAGILMSFIGVSILNLSREHGGPLTSLTRPIQILSSFFIWAAIEPFETIQMLSNIYVIAGIALAFVCAGLGQWYMVKGRVELHGALKTLLIVGFIAGFMSPLTKYGMSFTSEFAQAYVWGWCVHLTSFPMCFIRHCTRSGERPSLFESHVLKGGLIIGTIKVLIGPLIVTAYHLSPNPAFATLIFMLATVWLMIFYKIKKQETHINIKTAFLMILSAVIIIGTTNAYRYFDQL